MLHAGEAQTLNPEVQDSIRNAGGPQLNQLPVIILGAGETARLINMYLTRAGYTVCGHAVESKYVTDGLLDVDQLEAWASPRQVQLMVGVSFTDRLRLRQRLYEGCKAKGYSFLTYIHPSCFVDPEASIGEGSFIFERNVLQSKVRIGNNTILWSSNHVGHRTKIGNHCFISSHVVISGDCVVGDKVFMGVNSCVGQEVTIGENAAIGMGTVIKRGVMPGTIIKGRDSRDLD